jgi:hypothetical protein
MLRVCLHSDQYWDILHAPTSIPVVKEDYYFTELKLSYNTLGKRLIVFESFNQVESCMHSSYLVIKDMKQI